jgi:uncharacterized protein (DUF952 family)
MILHICPRAAWEQAVAAGVYEADTLTSQGFIHCSTDQQVLVPATVRFRGRTDLVLLRLAEERLPVPLTWEDGDPPHPEGALFPHLYAALPVDAVDAVVDFPPNEDGTFTLPAALT